MKRVGIINVTGYAGVELARILCRHPGVKLASVTGRSAAGQKLGEFFPHLSGVGLTITEELSDVDVVFSALNHKDSAAKCLPYIRKGLPVIDMSADFRLKSATEYTKWYKVEHPEPQRLSEAVYGLPELHKKDVQKTKIVANPGCYPTGAVLALAPAAKAGLIAGDVIVDSKSGVSGAGRTLALTTHISEVNEDVSAYGLDGHRHLPEITQELQAVDASQKYSVTFIPHLIPMTRGILSTCYATVKNGKLGAGGKGALMELYKDFYRDAPFVKVMAAPPHTKYTLGNNDCMVYPTIDERTGRLIVVSAIDNLVKGAAGAAVQNMNLMLGMPETMGLEQVALYP